MNWLKAIAIIGGVITIIFLMGSFTPLPILLFSSPAYVYFILLKWVTFVIGLYLALYGILKKQGAYFWVWASIFVAMAILWNPIWEFHIGNSNWKIMDVIVSAILLAFIVLELKGNSVSGTPPSPPSPLSPPPPPTNQNPQ